MIKKECFILFMLLVVVGSSPVYADEPFVEWHSSNIQLLRGWDYRVGEEERTLVTVEHANSWRYGDLFFFVDITRFDGGGSSVFGEFSPRFSFSKLSGQQPSKGLVKDVLIATTWEEGEKSTRAYLVGGAIDLNLPGFAFFQNMLYWRDDPNLPGDTWQVTWAWKYPFTVGSSQWVMEGFADIAGEEGSYHPNEHIVPRILWDAGDYCYDEPGKLYLGVEWEYWHNKYGIDGVTESHPQLQLKWVL